VVARPLAEIFDELSEALADDTLVLSHAQAVRDAEACLRIETVAHALTTKRLARVHELEATQGANGRLTKSWLIEEQLLTEPAAGRRMKLVRFLDNFPLVKAAYFAAKLTPTHVSALVSGLMSLPVAWWEAVEAPLVKHAQGCLPTEISGFIDDLLTAMGVDKKSDIQRERRNGALGFRLTKTMDGFYAASGLLDAETGHLLQCALHKLTVSRAPQDTRAPARRKHDALGEMARLVLAADQQPSFSGSPVGVMVTIPMELLEDRLREAWLTLPTGMRITADTARRLACNAEIIPVVLGSAGEVLDIGRASRHFTAAQRRAAYLEQGGRCGFRHCRRRCVDLHHIIWWRLDGRTSLDNAVWLCSYHHWLVHDGGWSLVRGPDRSFIWTNTIGTEQIRHLTAA